MSNPVFIKIAKGIENLFTNHTDFLIAKLLLPLQDIRQIFPSKLSYNDHLVVSLMEPKQFYNVFMAYLL